MTDLKQAAQQALKALESGLAFDTHSDVLQNLRTALEQQAEPICPECKAAVLYECVACSNNNYPPKQQAESVSHAAIAGALFDFMGWLTTRKERLILSSTDNASPAVESITEFAKMRGLSLDDARVQDWQNYTTPPQRPWVELEAEDLAQIESDEFWQVGNHMAIAMAVEAKLKERNNG